MKTVLAYALLYGTVTQSAAVYPWPVPYVVGLLEALGILACAIALRRLWRIREVRRGIIVACIYGGFMAAVVAVLQIFPDNR